MKQSRFLDYCQFQFSRKKKKQFSLLCHHYNFSSLYFCEDFHGVHFTAEMSAKLLSVFHFHLGHDQLRVLVRIAQNVLEESLGEFGHDVVPGRADRLERVQHGVVQLLHARGLLQQLDLGLREPEDGGGVADLEKSSNLALLLFSLLREKLANGCINT